MADNFNLRQFLSENKLTKNAKLLSENTDISQAFSQAGITGEVTVAFYSEHGMSEPEFEVMNAQDALAMIASEAKGAEDVLIAQGDEIDQQGDLDPQTKGLECKLEVAILNHGTYEVYQGSNSLNEGSDYGYEAVVDAIADHFDEGSYEYDQVLKAVEDKFHSNQIDTSDFSHDPSAPSRIVADIADELGLGEYENDEPSAGKYVSRRDIEENAQGDGWKYFDIDGDEVEGLYMDTVDGVKIYSMTDSSVADTVSYILEDPDGYVETIHIDVSGQPVSSEDIENEHEVISYIADFIADDINSELGLDEAFDHDAPQGDSYEEVVAWLDDKYPDASQYDKFVAAFKKELRNLPQDKKSQWTAKFKKDYGSLNEGKSYKTSSNSKEAQQLKKGDILTSGDEVVSVSAGAKTPSGKVEVTVKTKSGKTKTNTWGKTTKVGVKEKETVKESTLSSREKYLTRLVENALGLENTNYDPDNEEWEPEDDYPGQTRYVSRRDIEEGEEMVAEKPLPKYENIEKLMQEIEHGTNEAAYKHKMNKMKEVAEMLETRVAALEEGEGAEFIDTKKVKQMKKDIMTLRKQAEKLEKEYDKKFGEKKAKKETKTELREGFDLKKFLVENKLTANSRMLKEEVGGLDEAAGEDLELKSAAKQIFSILKKHGLKPNYISGDVKLDKVNDSVVAITKDANTGTGLIKVNIWAWAVSKNKVDMKKLNSDILQVLGNEFENKSGQTLSNNESVYTMIIRKKVGQADPEPAAQ